MRARTSKTTTAMIIEAQLQRLMIWLSPSFPVGSFGYSHGLETAIRDGRVGNAESLLAWVTALVEHGAGWSDAVLLRSAWEAAHLDDADGLAEIATLAEAMAPTRERRRETLDQGQAFLIAASAWGPSPFKGAIAYPVAVGATAAGAGIASEWAITAWVQAFTANLVNAAVRAVPLGQSAGVATLAKLEAINLSVCARAMASSLEDLGSAAFLSDIASMRHETLDGRIFIS
jgi:urease accessory protein